MVWPSGMEESAWYSKCRTFKVSGSFSKGRPRDDHCIEEAQYAFAGQEGKGSM